MKYTPACEQCGKLISQGEHDYSVASFMRKPLCLADQLKFKASLKKNKSLEEYLRIRELNKDKEDSEWNDIQENLTPGYI